MTTKYKILIILTFLIASCILLSSVPRYEIKENIIELECVESGCLVPKFQGEVIQSYCLDNFDDWYDRICYIKEKIRTN